MSQLPRNDLGDRVSSETISNIFNMFNKSEKDTTSTKSKNLSSDRLSLLPNDSSGGMIRLSEYNLLSKMYSFMVSDYRKKKTRSEIEKTKENSEKILEEKFLTKLLSVIIVDNQEEDIVEKKTKKFNLGFGILVGSTIGAYLYNNLDEIKKIFDSFSSFDGIKSTITDTINELSNIKIPQITDILEGKLPDLNINLPSDTTGLPDTTLEGTQTPSQTRRTGNGTPQTRRDFERGEQTRTTNRTFSRESRFEDVGLRPVLKRAEAKTYNTIVGGSEANLTDMTLDEVLSFQTKMKASGKYPSTAVGKYQIIKSTLLSAKKELQLSGDEKFNEQLQDRIYKEYLIGKKRQKVADFISGKSDDLQGAQLELAQEFASFGVPYDVKNNKGIVVKKGESYYKGQAGNKASVSPERSAQALLEERQIRLTGYDSTQDNKSLVSDTNTNTATNRSLVSDTNTNTATNRSLVSDITNTNTATNRSLVSDITNTNTATNRSLVSDTNTNTTTNRSLVSDTNTPIPTASRVNRQDTNISPNNSIQPPGYISSTSNTLQQNNITNNTSMMGEDVTSNIENKTIGQYNQHISDMTNRKVSLEPRTTNNIIYSDGDRKTINIPQQEKKNNLITQQLSSGGSTTIINNQTQSTFMTRNEHSVPYTPPIIDSPINNSIL